MTEGDLRRRLAGINEDKAQELKAEAERARVSLINTVAEIVQSAFLYDVETLEKAGGSDGVLYAKVHQAEEGQTNDAFGEWDHVSVHLTEELPSGSTQHEIYLRVPVSKRFVRAFIEAGAEPPMEAWEIMKAEGVKSVYVQHIERTDRGVRETYKRVTPFGSLEYKHYIDEQIHASPLKRFMRLFSRSAQNTEESDTLRALRSKMIVDTDLGYINEMRQDIINLRLTPQAHLGRNK